MTTLKHLRCQQILREAEGYLDLIIACSEPLQLSVAVRERLAQRALDTISNLDGRRGDRAQVAYLTGQALRAMERHLEAIEQLETAAELDSNNLHVWLALGWCYKRTSRLDLAIQSLEEALALDPGRAIIYYNLACYWSLASNSKLALEYLTRAFELDPSYRELVADESDFDPIRHDPRFQELTSVIV